VLLTFFLSVWCGRDQQVGRSPANYNFEMGFFLDPAKSLKASDSWKLKDSVADALNIDNDETIEMKVVFIDSLDKQLDALHWDIRFRSTTDAKGYELTYKKRYPIGTKIGGPPDNLDAVVAQAESDGFDSDEKSYAAQVDVLWSKWTLSFSNSKVGNEEGEGKGELPSQKDMRKYTLEMAPGKLEKSFPNLEDIVNNGHFYGPVRARRFFGSFMELKIELEIWEVKNATKNGYEYLVDLSFKDAGIQHANAVHEALRSYLINMDWILPEDILKTSIILSRY